MTKPLLDPATGLFYDIVLLTAVGLLTAALLMVLCLRIGDRLSAKRRHRRLLLQENGY